MLHIAIYRIGLFVDISFVCILQDSSKYGGNYDRHWIRKSIFWSSNNIFLAWQIVYSINKLTLSEAIR